MKLKLKKQTNGDWQGSVHIGKGGVSSMIAGRTSKSFWWTICVFKPKNLWKAYKGKH